MSRDDIFNLEPVWDSKKEWISSPAFYKEALALIPEGCDCSCGCKGKVGCEELVEVEDCRMDPRWCHCWHNGCECCTDLGYGES